MGGQRGRLIPAEKRQEGLDLVDTTVQSGARQAQACEMLQISSRTYQRWKKAPELTDKRQLNPHSPPNKLSEAERAQIVDIANSTEFCDLPPCQIVPRLADRGDYVASESTFYRVLREKKHIQHRGRSKAPTQAKPKALIANKANCVWSWDISYLPTLIRGLFFYWYLIIDIYSRKIVGSCVEEKESTACASLLMKAACQQEGISPNQLTLHSDNGAPMKGATLVCTLEGLGVSRSYSRPAVSNDNPYSESLFKTAKYCPYYPEFFATLEDARVWVTRFIDGYNNEHCHSGLNFVTPAQRHTREDIVILENRTHVYAKAKAEHPERWSSNCRYWTLPTSVILNPGREIQLQQGSY